MQKNNLFERELTSILVIVSGPLKMTTLLPREVLRAFILNGHVALV